MCSRPSNLQSSDTEVPPAGAKRSFSRAFVIDAMVCAGLFASVVAVYWPARSFEWIALDDPDVVFANPHVLSGLSWHAFRWAFTSFNGALWQPATMLSFLLDVRIFGARPGPMHLENVLLHALSAVCWYAVLKGMTRQRAAAFFVAALFALHPAHIESVAWITERKDVLSMLMLVTSLMWYWRYTIGWGWVAYVASVVFCALALLSKPMMVTLPALLLLIDFWPLGRTSWWQASGLLRKTPPISTTRLIIEKIPFAALALAASIVALLSQSSAGAISGFAGHSISQRVSTAIVGYTRYLGVAFWPHDLTIFYPYRSDIPPAAVWISILLLMFVTAIAVRLRTTRPYLIVGWIWYVLTLLPVIGIIQVGSQSIADRYTYLPFVGLSIAVVWSVAAAFKRHRSTSIIAIVVGVAVLVGCVMMIRIYLPRWKNTLSLFDAAAKVIPSDPFIEFELGEGYRMENRTDQAIEHYDRSLAISPNQFSSQNNLANLLLPYFPELALPHYQAAVRINPGSYVAHYNYGLCLEKLKDGPAARVEFEKARRLKQE